MAAKNKEQIALDLRGPERVFQLDRDTYVVYTGRSKTDFRPFVRIGSGSLIPRGVLGQIENVVLPEGDPVNVGLEMAWIHETIQEASERIRYVGSRDRVSQIYNFSGMPDLEEEERPIEIEAYTAPTRGEETPRDRCTIQFFETGNAQIQVSGSKVYDHSSIQRTRMTLDREFDQVVRAMKRRKAKGNAETPRSFVYVGEPYEVESARPFIYWNFAGKGLLLNPVLDYHQALFERDIDPSGVSTAVSYSPLSPGFVEVLRRKSVEEAPVAFFTADEDRVSVLKKIYSGAKLKFLNDGSVLPDAREQNFYLSRTASHGAFSYRFSSEDDRMVQIVFPMGGNKKSKSFDYIKGPHDLEILPYSDRDELKEGRAQAHLTLALPGKVGKAVFLKRKLEDGLYPLVPRREYIHNSFSDSAQLAEPILAAFKDTAYDETIRSLVLLNLGIDFSPAALTHALQQVAMIAPPQDMVALNNLSECLRYISNLPAFKNVYNPAQKKLLERCRKKFSISRLRFGDWLQLEEQAYEMQLLFLQGRYTYHLAVPSRMEPVYFQFPPDTSELIENPKDYARMLRKQARAIEKADDPPGYAGCLELMEKILEDRLRLVEERKRFEGLLDALEIKRGKNGKNDPSQEESESGGGFIDNLFESPLKIVGLVLGGLAALGLVIGIGYLIFRLVAGLMGADSSAAISTNGDSAAEIAAVTLAEPGTVQQDKPVPGEDSIEASNREVFFYANALAVSNGFRPLGGADDADRKNPDRVFPGDKLKLPDGRVAHVEPGQYIWEIAEKHYKKDFARLHILGRQVQNLKQTARGDPDSEVQKDIQNRLQHMQRLAITNDMKAYLKKI